MKYHYDWKDLKDYAAYALNPGEEPEYPLAVYALGEITPDVLVGISDVFFPQFVLHENCVFLADHFDQTRYANWKKTYGDSRKIDSMSIISILLIDIMAC